MEKTNKHSISFIYLNGHSYTAMRKEFLYLEIANRIAFQITSGNIKAGDRLPSVRQLCQLHGIGMNTAKRIFLELESRSLIETRPQSGYFVSQQLASKLPLPQSSSPSLIANDKEPIDLTTKVYGNIGNEDLTLFSIGVPSGNLLPLAKLKKEIIRATTTLHEGGTEYEPLQGNVKLRRTVAARSPSWGGRLSEQDIVTTNGGMNALSLCLMALARPGDTVAMESPCYPGIFQLALSLGLKVLELPTHPVTGIDIDTLRKVVSKINLCLLIPNFNTPLGSCMPDAHKQEVVDLLATHAIPLIEDDIYGDLHFGPIRPKCCKAFDKGGNVLLCSSVSKTLAPGYRVGWIAPGNYLPQIMKLKLVHALSSTSIIQEAVGNFLWTGNYDKHLRQLRRTLADNYQRYAQTIAENFPAGTRVNHPQGGLALWVELPPHIDTRRLHDLAIRQGISIAPGRIFTLQEQFQHCMRLCIGLPWSDHIRLKLKQLGALAKAL
ncbi:aminotransferase-like domain-containing protein [Sphingobacterium suaedae]|uniref:PLP-dependent aminotransferase family protein n=1 Tax=Sphingobacterium suaedae TaxID=1686402 RepID=A0ABW5KPL6_9SPHI